MIPLKDNIVSRKKPYVVYSLLIINIIVFIAEITFGKNLIYEYGCIPIKIIHWEDLHTLFTSMFLHADFTHIIGNMLFLYIFGDNVEDAMGHFWFIVFYIMAGIAGSFLHILFNFNSTIPTIGASGAISGILGSYFILYPRAKVLTVVFLFFFIRLVYLPAFIMLGIWFLYQLFLGFASLPTGGGGIAFFAHIGGFLFGMLISSFVKQRKRKQISAMF